MTASHDFLGHFAWSMVGVMSKTTIVSQVVHDLMGWEGVADHLPGSCSRRLNNNRNGKITFGYFSPDPILILKLEWFKMNMVMSISTLTRRYHKNHIISAFVQLELTKMDNKVHISPTGTSHKVFSLSSTASIRPITVPIGRGAWSRLAGSFQLASISMPRLCTCPLLVGIITSTVNWWFDSLLHMVKEKEGNFSLI